MKAPQNNKGARGAPTARDTYGTPWKLYWELEYRFGRGEYHLDVCAEEWSAKCAQFFTVAEDGLAQPWVGRCFCNPPFKAVADWLAKGLEELTAERVELVTFLLPNRSWAKWYHEYKSKHPGISYHEYPGRVYYEPPPGVVVKRESPYEGALIIQMEHPLNMSDLTRPSERVRMAA